MKRYVIYEMKAKVFSCSGMDTCNHWTENINNALTFFYKEEAEQFISYLPIGIYEIKKIYFKD